MARVKVPGVLEAYDLITLEYARLVIGGFKTPDAPQGTYTQDGMIVAFIHAVSDRVAKECHRDFQYKQYVELKDGDGKVNWLYCLNPPIVMPPTATFKVWVGRNAADEFDDDHLQTEHDHYEVTTGSGKVKFYSILPFGYNNIQVEYTGGWLNIPASLAGGTALWVAEFFKLPDDKRHGLLSKSQDGWTANINNEPFPGRVLEMITPWILPAGR